MLLSTRTPSYTAAWVLLYTSPGRERYASAKYNPKPPASALVPWEAARSARGVLIVTCYDWMLSTLHRDGTLPLQSVRDAVPWSLESTPLAEVPVLSVLSWILPLYIWSDCHFYWTHRMLHSPLLFKVAAS